MDLRNYPRKEYSITQFTQALCYELEGESFRFVMDSGYDYILDIIDGENCLWCVEGEEPKSVAYQCLKGDDSTYILSYEPKNCEKRTNHTFVIDREQGLVTFLRCVRGLNPKNAYMVESFFDFGYIHAEDETPPFRRHAFNMDLMGSTVEWHWGTEMVTRHAYLEPAFYRLTWPDDSAAAQDFAYMEGLPSSDEPARYIKIKKNMYLFVLTEKNSERYAKGSPFHSNNMAFLQNYDRMIHVGRSFGTMTMPDGKDKDVATMFGAFGNPVHIPEKFLTPENPFTV